MHKNNDSTKKTKEYIEKTYYNSTNYTEFDYNLVQVSKFWLDAYESLLNREHDDVIFLSVNFVYCTRNLSEKVFALALLDQPFTSPSHEYIQKDEKHYFKLATDCFILIKDLQNTKAVSAGNNTLAAQRWFDFEERYIYNHDLNKQVEKEVKEFIKGRVYGSQIVVTNVTSIEQSIQVIAEIPQGSIPIKTLGYFTTNAFNLAPFSTKNLEFFFYFPKEGEFTFYPASITKDGEKVEVQVNKDKLKCLAEAPKKETMETLQDILSQGSKTDIINFMKTKNISNTKIFDFKKIYWLLKDEEFYYGCLEVLRERMIYNEKVWSYSIYHGDYKTSIELLNEVLNSETFGQQFMMLYFKTDKFNIDLFSLKEYHPLFNNRFHALMAGKCNIANSDFEAQYTMFLMYLVNKLDEWTGKDYLVFAYYLLLQERVDDAKKIISKCEEREKDKTNIKTYDVQYDYLKAYFDLYDGYPKFEVARSLCDKHCAHPIITWRNKFVEMANQLAEYDGELKDIKNNKTDDATKQNLDPTTDPSLALKFDVEVNGANLKFEVYEVETVKIEYFYIDLEILFSRSPFIQAKFDDFIYVSPNFISNVTLPRSTETKKIVNHEIEIPKDVRNKNMVLKLTPNKGTYKTMIYFCSNFTLNINEELGMIKVFDSSLIPMPKSYVKCFAKISGSTVFFRDGYTDLRGSFNYLDVKETDYAKITKFSIQVVSEKYGSKIKECNPPKASAHVENRQIQMASENWQHKQKGIFEQKYAHLRATKVPVSKSKGKKK